MLSTHADKTAHAVEQIENIYILYTFQSCIYPGHVSFSSHTSEKYMRIMYILKLNFLSSEWFFVDKLFCLCVLFMNENSFATFKTSS